MILPIESNLTQNQTLRGVKSGALIRVNNVEVSPSTRITVTSRNLLVGLIFKNLHKDQHL